MTMQSKLSTAAGITQYSDYLASSADEHPIHIISGEGENGTVEVYEGKRTDRAIKMRLTKERCQGDRWARASIYLYDSDHQIPVGMDCETGEMDYFPTFDD